MSILIAIVIFVLFIRAVENKKAAQRIAERLRVARLRRHADEEIGLIKEGKMAGVYGQFVPPPSMYGVGLLKEGI